MKEEKKIKQLAEFMHNEYEDYAKKVGWKTQKDCLCHKVKPEGVGEWEVSFKERFSSEGKEFVGITLNGEYLLLGKTDDALSFISTLLLQEKAKWKEEVEEFIKDNNKWKNENQTCGLCLEEEYCCHEIENGAYEKVLTLIDKL